MYASGQWTYEKYQILQIKIKYYKSSQILSQIMIATVGKSVKRGEYL